jgi:hypothetical protein
MNPLSIGLQLIQAIDEAVEVAGPDGIPSGHLYAILMAGGVTLPAYDAALGVLKDSGRIQETGYLLTHKKGK